MEEIIPRGYAEYLVRVMEANMAGDAQSDAHQQQALPQEHLPDLAPSHADGFQHGQLLFAGDDIGDQYARDNRGLEGWFLIPEQAILELLSYDSLNAHLLVSTEADREEAVGEELAELVAARTELDT